jgi:hypothetical protein
MASLEQMMDAILTRDGTKPTGKSLVIPNHLAQMRLFGIRQGLEFYPAQDESGIRKRFIDKLYTDNRIDLYLDRIWDLFLCGGQILWYLRPTGDSYRIYYFPRDQFRAYYDGDGDLTKTVIIYAYNIEAESESLKSKKWVRLEITKEKIIQSESESKPNFTTRGLSLAANASTTENTLGFIPCVVSSNYLTEAGQEGHGDFDWLRDQIEDHENKLISISANLEFFGNPSLVTSRQAKEVTEGNTDAIFTGGDQRSTWASADQWVGSTRSTFKRDPFQPQAGPMGGNDRIRRVIGNVEAEERFGYIVPDPITPDHLRQVAEQREALHTALGGVDPLSISAGATAFEVKSLYGRTAATALKKSKLLYTYGLSKVLEMAIQSEEIALKRSLSFALKIPIERLSDQFTMDLVVYGRDKLPKDYQPIGLPPLGDRTVDWKWLGPVFEDSPQDLLQKSIVVRNLEEIGVETIEALGFLFSDKTRREREAMLTGYPFREMNASSSALQQQLSVFGQLMQMPDPYTGQPMGLSLNNLEVIQATIEHMKKRLNYGTNTSPADGDPGGFTSAPSGGGNALGYGQSAVPNAGYGSNGAPVLPGTAPNGPSGAIPVNGSAAAAGLAIGGSGFSGNPAAAGLDRSGYQLPQPERGDPLPVPGGTVSRAANGPGPVLGLPSIALPGVNIPPDLQSSPGILQQLFPSLFGPANADPNAGGNRRRQRRK